MLRLQLEDENSKLRKASRKNLTSGDPKMGLTPLKNGFDLPLDETKGSGHRIIWSGAISRRLSLISAAWSFDQADKSSQQGRNSNMAAQRWGLGRISRYINESCARWLA
jgi:hypothetical protein